MQNTAFQTKNCKHIYLQLHDLQHEQPSAQAQLLAASELLTNNAPRTKASPSADAILFFIFSPFVKESTCF